MKRFILLLFLCSNWWTTIMAQSFHIGDLYTTPDGSQGIIYYILPDRSGGWVVALHDASTGCAWGNLTDVPGLTATSDVYTQNLLYDTMGYANTQAICTHQNNDITYAAGTVNFNHGWVLPSPAQLSMLYGQLPFISAAITNAGGTDLAYTWYWSSGEHSANNAWGLNFSDECDALSCGGALKNILKTTMCRVRSVYCFKNTSVIYDTSLSYLWNTGSTQPYINISPTQTTTYTVTATTNYGCSNTAEQTIIVGTSAEQTIYDTICQGMVYEANGFNFSTIQTSTPGTFSQSRPINANDCTSSITLFLTVCPRNTRDIYQIACEKYTWNGITYYESGNYTQHFNNKYGCDSIVTLHLTITGVPTVNIITVTDTICIGTSVSLQAIAVTNPINPSISPVYHNITVGDILCTDGSFEKPSSWSVSGKIAKGIVFYVDDTGLHGWAVHLQDQSTSTVWGNDYTDISTLQDHLDARNAIMDLNGYTNTQLIREAGNATSYPAAWAMDFSNGWYFPAIGQLSLIFSEIITVNASLQLVGGTPFPMDSFFYYWSSTEFQGNSVWGMHESGSIDTHWKGMNDDNNHRVRSICDF